MSDIRVDPEQVAYCGIYCAACPKLQKERCPGCHGNEKASWCKVRSCCIEHDYATCADCTEFSDPTECRKFNNFFSKMIGFVLRSDRPACIQQVKTLGLEGHAKAMASLGRVSLKP